MASPERQNSSRNRLPLLLGLCAILGALVGWDWLASGDAGGTSRPALPRTAQPVSGVELAPLAGLTLDGLQSTVQRPLFERDRRTPEPAKPLAQVEPAPAPANPMRDSVPTLAGILTSNGRRVALLRLQPSGQSVRAELGETIEGWTIVKIEPQGVVLRQGRRDLPLTIFDQ